MDINTIAKKAKEASIRLAAVSTEEKDKGLERIAQALLDRQEEILAANRADLQRSEEEALGAPLLKRLKFDQAKIREVVDGIRSLIGLPDPVGKVLMETELDEGLLLVKESCPIGVIGIIFESRPDALVQISSLCLKSGNAVLLKGGSEARETNRILSQVIQDATQGAQIPQGWLHNLATREDVQGLLKLDEWIDLIIPRGSNEFVRHIMDNSRIPVLGHADGICHGYIHEDADLEMAVRVANDSKTQYVAVCNAMETLLVHKGIAPRVLPPLAEKLKESNVKILGCPRTRALIPCVEATEEDWKTEYLDYTLSIKVVDNLMEAIDHINTYGSGHTETILTQSQETADIFMDLVDAGNVFHNCSTRFSDGLRYGFGAEVGISTNKIHARGPVGLEGLMIYKYKLEGNGHIVKEYSDGVKKFHHKYLR
ncbi:glutamate-5-semialdehyde dehydrogenase [Anaerotalea alkaliphila]|uniref:Gamma-glutamyl phosphate reductase n=1 Tax=Anaerotalea alkaliphila TaxID=2662126 RepID=A0A7X5HV25_9FIRM|nr:glutamate-5-semialdehyde dehydrogenase [Anaerotalea alkaliphila]NDL67194.1 glutamate-5-semialdehyde dehydrogenase [Anaerotalea alkaliphila]